MRAGLIAFALSHLILGRAGAAELPAGMSALLDASEAHDAEVVRFADDRSGGLLLATRVAAEPQRLIATLAEPATYQRAVPAFAKAEVKQVVPSTGARLVAWELEVPLWNFAGTLWMRPQRTGVVLELVDGDLAPGKLTLTVLPSARPGGKATLTVSGSIAIER
ncbi:MAG TPA: hypothetical protein VGF45_04885, partial [Polyangia bacterium]